MHLNPLQFDTPERIASAFLCDFWELGNEETARALIASDVVRRHPRNPIYGLEEYLNFVQGFRSAFCGFHNEILHVVGDINSVAVHYRSSGKHNGWLGNLPPSLRSGEIEALDLYKLRDGKIFEIVPIWDELALVTHLGLYCVNPLYFLKNWSRYFWGRLTNAIR